jgi:predicted transglutaminase-like cysteine proteinase
MRDRLDAPVSALEGLPAGGIGRREFAQCMAAGWLLLATCGARGQLADPGSEPGPSELRRACAEFDAMAFAASRLDLDARAVFVNVAVNRCVSYALDPPSAPGADVWSTPFETLARGTGDCEDFAIAKFYLLVASGVPLEGVRLLYAIYRWPDRSAPSLPHLVTVAGWPLADPGVLDCINPLVVPLSRRDDLDPIFSFDRSAIWPGVDAQPLAGRRRRIERWQRAQARTLRQAQEGQRDRRKACPTFIEARTARSTACIERRRAMPPSSSTAPTWISSAL